MPLPGASVLYPKNEMEQIYHAIAARDDVSLTTCTHKVKDFSIEFLSGDYRKIILKPEALEYDLVTYKKSYEPLLKSDLELLQESGAHDAEATAPEGRKRKHASEDDTDRKCPRVEAHDKDETDKLALKLKFKLPSSAYATMLVRQLTKCSTSKIDQISITNDSLTKIGMQ